MASFDDPEIFRAVLDSLQAGVYLVDRDRKILFWNAGAERLTGYLRQDTLGRSSREDFLGHIDNDNNEMNGEEAPLETALRNSKAIDAQISVRHKNGHRIPMRLHAAPIRNGNGKVIGAVESFHEMISVADWDRRHNKLAACGCLDEATGVLNHGMVESHLREFLGTYAKHPVPFSILCIRIDELEMVKARHGPGAFAAVLRVVGQTLEGSLRPTDFIGRWQENEFLAILAECSGEEIVKAGERLAKMARQSKIEWWGDMLGVTISMGSAVVKWGDDAQSIVRRAEKGLQKASHTGIAWSYVTNSRKTQSRVEPQCS
jgi:diguanylate cyclase (GGDEF)-like protein/PAS domain S-box-containing protein